MTDGSRSYTVFLYNSMNWGGSGAGIGFTDGSSFYTLAGGEGFSAFSAVASLPTASNVGVDGVYIFRTDSSEFPVTSHAFLFRRVWLVRVRACEV